MCFSRLHIPLFLVIITLTHFNINLHMFETLAQRFIQDMYCDSLLYDIFKGT